MGLKSSGVSKLAKLPNVLEMNTTAGFLVATYTLELTPKQPSIIIAILCFAADAIHFLDRSHIAI